MRLDRNAAEGSHAKYALVLLRRLCDATANIPMECTAALQTLIDNGLIRFSEPGKEDEFFAIMLKDTHARPALLAYAGSAMTNDIEYARDVRELAARASENSKWCKDPD